MSSNLLVAWSNLIDSAGRRVKEYKLNFDYHWSDVLPRIFGGITEITWDVFMFLAVSAASFLSWVSSPSWLNGLDSIYQSITSKALNSVNPFIIGVAGFGILIVYMSLDKVKSTSNRFDSNDMNRVATAVALLGGISVLVANPFMLLKGALSVVQIIVSAIAGDDTESGNMSSFSVDAMIRQPTLIINYSGSVSEKCADIWSKTGELTAKSGCIEAGASTPGAMSFVLSILAVIMSLSAFVFAAVSLYKFAKHLTVSVLGFVSLSWVAAASLFRRRQFDQLGTVFAVACGHMVMVFVVQIISLGLPTLVSRVMHEWGQTDFAVLQMMALAACYVVFTALLLSATSKSSALVRALKADSMGVLNKLQSPGSGTFSNLDGRTFKQSFTDLNPYTQYNKAWNTLKGNDYFQKITRGKFAEKGEGEDTAVDTATDAQRTVSLGGRVKNIATASIGGAGAALSWAKKRGKGGDILSAPSSAGADMASAAATQMLMKVGNNGANPLEADAILLPGQEGYNGSFDPKTPVNTDTVGRSFYESNLQAENPYIGGLTPVPVVTGEVDRLVGDINTKLRGFERINEFLMDMGVDHDALRAYLSEDRADASENWERLMALAYSAGDVAEGMESIRAAIESSQSSASDAQSKALVTMADAQRTSIDQMSRFIEASRNRAGTEVTALNRGDGGESEHAQRITNIQTNVQNVTVSVAPTAGVGVIRNALRGGESTPGDVGITRINHTCDRAEAQVAFEETQLELMATGKSTQLAIPETDARFNVRFSPDRPGHAVSPAFDVGFGDSIF